MKVSSGFSFELELIIAAIPQKIEIEMAANWYEEKALAPLESPRNTIKKKKVTPLNGNLKC